MLTDHGKCCFVVLLGYQPLTDGICDDVLDAVEGIAGETVNELTQEEKGIKEIYDSWYLKGPKYLFKYDLLNLITLQKRFKHKNL